MSALVVYSPPATEPVTISEVLQHCRIDASNQEPAPGAINVALGAGAGNVDNGAHRYLCTFVTADGETQAGDISALASVSDKSANGKIALSNIQIGGSNVTARKIYRTAAGGSTYLFLATIADNTTTTYTDNIADASLGAQAPSTNSTADPLLRMLIASARHAAEARLKRYLVTQTVDLYLDGFPDWQIKLPPIQSVLAITYIDTNGSEQTIAADQYLVDAVSQPARITPAYGLSWPSARYQSNSVKVRFVAGYGPASAVPECIKNWMLLRIKQQVDQRDVINIASGSVIELPYSYVDGVLDPECVRGF
jgi:uncharacterized phiE125 gp8 family phage protein